MPRIHIWLKDVEVSEIEEIKRLDPDAKRSALIREAVIAFKPEYQKRLKYLKEREQQRR